MSTRRKRIHTIINPASGNNEPILNTLNDVFKRYAIDWTVSITQGLDDAREQAQAAVADGVDIVAAYGGDGTQLDAATGLIGSEVPLGILPGGTANALADEMHVPLPLHLAAELLCQPDHVIRAMDVGKMRDRYFLLRVGTGMIATFSEGATRELKDRFGIAAYIISGIQALSQPQYVHYSITVDGETFETDGAACLVTNANSLGALSIQLSQHVKADDGLLDLFILNNDLQTIVSMAGSIARLDDFSAQLQHWQGKEIHIEADPPQGIYGDGEDTPFTHTPATIELLPAAINVVVPPEENL